MSPSACDPTPHFFLCKYGHPETCFFQTRLWGRATNRTCCGLDRDQGRDHSLNYIIGSTRKVRLEFDKNLSRLISEERYLSVGVKGMISRDLQSRFK